MREEPLELRQEYLKLSWWQRLQELAQQNKPDFEIALVAKREAYSHDPAHDDGHNERVFRTAQVIGEEIGADMGILAPAAAYHDLHTEPKNIQAQRGPDGIHETDVSAEYAGQLLEIKGEMPRIISAVQRVIRECSLSKGLLPETPEGKVLATADKLDQLGNIGFLRYGASGGQMRRQMFNPEDPLPVKLLKEKIPNGKYKIADPIERIQIRRTRNLGEFDSDIDALIKRTPPIQEHIYTSKGREIATRRNEEFFRMLDEFQQELAENQNFKDKPWTSETGAIGILRAAHEVGENRGSLYHLRDPIGEKRQPGELEPQKYAVDRIRAIIDQMRLGQFEDMPRDIIDRRLKFMQTFLSELKQDIEGE